MPTSKLPSNQTAIGGTLYRNHYKGWSKPNSLHLWRENCFGKSLNNLLNTFSLRHRFTAWYYGSYLIVIKQTYQYVWNDYVQINMNFIQEYCVLVIKYINCKNFNVLRNFMLCLYIGTYCLVAIVVIGFSRVASKLYFTVLWQIRTLRTTD